MAGGDDASMLFLTRSTLSICALAFCLVSACGQVSVLKDVSYLEVGRPDKVDIYSPQQVSALPLPAVLLIHGGGWKSGDKADKRAISTTIAEAGYVVFAINYHLSEQTSPDNYKASWPQNFYDCKSALRFMRKNAKQYGLDPDRIAVMGESAGGHLALLVGSTAEDAVLNRGGLYTEQSNKVTCIIDMYGIADLTDLAAQRKWVTSHFRGDGAAQTAANLRIASPITYINATTPPVLIIHGTADPTVPFDMSQKLADRLKQLHVPYEFVPVPGAGHAFNLQPKEMDLRGTVLEFLKAHDREMHTASAHGGGS
jgi:acetyl esterase/lipase